MVIEQQYPSTDDLTDLVIAPVESPVTTCLRRARKRIEVGHTRMVYMTTIQSILIPRVCAIGAMWREEVSNEMWTNDIHDHFDSGRAIADMLENYLSEAVKTAIDLLNVIARERHPEMDRCSWRDEWSGPLEWVNQDWLPRDYPGGPNDEATKIEILAIYDEAIDRSLLLTA